MKTTTNKLPISKKMNVNEDTSTIVAKGDTPQLEALIYSLVNEIIALRNCRNIIETSLRKISGPELDINDSIFLNLDSFEGGYYLDTLSTLINTGLSDERKCYQHISNELITIAGQ